MIPKIEKIQKKPGQRLHKLLANAGVGSRRAIEAWIKEGKIQVNGVPALVGQSITLKDRVLVNGKSINLNDYDQEATRVLIYHKAEGEICSNQSLEGKKSVFASLPRLNKGKWVMVGRLDVNTSGLLLFTNQGELAHRLMHPSYQIERQYAVRVLGKVTEEMIARLKEGVDIDNEIFRFKEINLGQSGGGANQWYTVVLEEGKYREIRRLWASQDCIVSRLIRVKYGNVALPRDLRRGQARELTPGRVQELLSTVRLSTIPNKPTMSSRAHSQRRASRKFRV